MKTLIFVLAALAIPMSAHAATKHHRSHHTRTYQPQIACTDVGCLPVPRGCYPTGGKTADGSPSGFDVMVCPGGTRYGHL
jgi:hypothetical protein